jgi:hypothetical protein
MAIAEVAARWVAGRIASHSYASPNNSLGDRFWRQYTAPVLKQGERRVIVITNSQGYLIESDPSQSYPARLERLLNQRGGGAAYRVANWALPGANAAEMVILAARAADHRPDAVVLLAYSNNFSQANTSHPLSYARNDVEQLAYLPQVRGRLSQWFIDHYQISRPRGWLASRSGLVHLHDSFVFWMRDDRNLEERSFQALQERPAIPAEEITVVGARLMREIRNALQRGVPHTPVLVVSMPLSPAKILPETRAYAQSFLQEATEIFHDASQFKVLDATNAIEDPRLFYSATHIRPEGHERFSRWLLPHVLQVLNRPKDNAI